MGHPIEGNGPAGRPKRGYMKDAHAVAAAGPQQHAAVRERNPPRLPGGLLLTRTVEPVRIDRAGTPEDQR